MQTMRLVSPMTIAEVIQMLQSEPAFGFEALCQMRGADSPDKLKLRGLDGKRCIMLHSDADIVTFLSSLQQTAVPAIEIRLPRPPLVADPSEHHKVGVESGRKRGRDPRDQIEELEDRNQALTKESLMVQRRLTDLEREIATSHVKNQGAINKAQKEMAEMLEQATQRMDSKIDALKDDDQSILRDLDVVRQHGFAVEKQDNDHHQEIHSQLDSFATRVDSQFDEVNDALERLKEEDERLDQQAIETRDNHQSQLDQHLQELQVLEEEKVKVTVWLERCEATDKRVADELAALDSKFTEELASLDTKFQQEQTFTEERFAKETSEREHADAELEKNLQETTERIDADLQRLDQEMKAGFEAAHQALQETRQELSQSIEEKVSDLRAWAEKRTDQIEHTMQHKDEKINLRVDELTGRTEATFTGMNEKVDQMATEERARLSQIVKDFNEAHTKLRADLRSEVECVRSDLEKAASRLDQDLDELHKKHDVTKQEINFFQSKLKEQRDWTERQLAENSTATRAAAVDSQEGLTATTKMLNALREDSVSFREKMAKYISILQHSSDSQGEAINSLEMNRSRMRAELDALIGDHKAYTGDMDGWADDVRVKVERLFRALEPPRVEWKIARAFQRAKEISKPMALKSPSFAIKGIREGFMEFFPEGHNNTPEGKNVLRVFLPPQAHIRYQTWIGKATEGPREYTPGDNLSVDIFMDPWQDQVEDDGSLNVRLEVLRDYAVDDQSLARELRIESQ